MGGIYIYIYTVNNSFQLSYQRLNNNNRHPSLFLLSLDARKLYCVYLQIGRKNRDQLLGSGQDFGRERDHASQFHAWMQQ
jgi:hypothetical protein